MKAVIFCDIPEQFKSMVHAFYSQSFQAYQSVNRKESGKMDTSGIAVECLSPACDMVSFHIKLCRGVNNAINSITVRPWLFKEWILQSTR